MARICTLQSVAKRTTYSAIMVILHSTKKRRSLNVCHFHVRSLVSDGRLEQLKFFLSAHSVDVLCLTGTWLKPKHVNSMLSVSCFQPALHCDRITSRGGGVAINVRDGLASTLLALPPSELECLAVRIDLSNRKKLIVFVIYRPPDSNVWDLVDALVRSVSPYLQGNVCMLDNFIANTLCGMILRERMLLASSSSNSQTAMDFTKWSMHVIICVTPGFDFHQSSRQCH